MELEIRSIGKRLFVENGYDKTKITDITGRLEISSGNFYRYYSSKEALLVSILRDEQEEYVKELENLKYTDTFYEKLSRVSEVNLRFVLEKTDVYAFILRLQEKKLKRQVEKEVNRLEIATKEILKEIMYATNLERYKKETLYSLCCTSINTYCRSLIRDEDDNYLLEEVLLYRYDELYQTLIEIVKGICYSLGANKRAFSRYDSESGVLKREYLINEYEKRRRELEGGKEKIVIATIEIEGIGEKSFFRETILRECGEFLNSSFRSIDVGGRLDEYVFGIVGLRKQKNVYLARLKELGEIIERKYLEKKERKIKIDIVEKEEDIVKILKKEVVT